MAPRPFSLRSGHGHPHHAHGLFFRPSARTCHARRGDRPIRAQLHSGASCHGFHHDLADGAVLGKGFGGHAKDLLLDSVVVGHHPTPHRRTGTRHRGEHGRDAPARARFRGADGLASFLKHAEHRLRQSRMAPTNDMVCCQGHKSVGFGFQELGKRCAVFGRSFHAQADLHLPWRRQVRQRHPFCRQGLLPIGHQRGQRRLADACGDHGFVQRRRQLEVGAQARQDLVVHQPLHLVGHAWHAHHHLARRPLKPHARGRAQRVGQHRACAGQHGLKSVHLEKGHIARFEPRLDLGCDVFMHHELRPKMLGQHMLGQVVFGGPQSAGQQHGIRRLQRPVQFLANRVRVV